MRKNFLSLALALMALMAAMPAKAARIPVWTYQELFRAIGQGYSDAYALTDEDIISVEADISWNVSQGTCLFVSSNRTRNLDLNGHTLRYETGSEQYFFAITIKDNSVLNIYDSEGGGKFLCVATSNLANPVQEYDRYRHTNECLYGVSNCVVNMSEGNNSVLNVYGGTLSAQIGNSTSYDNTSVTYHSPSILMESDLDTQKKFKTNTVNIYGGKLSSILNQYSIPLNDIYISNNPKFSNEKVTINLYGGELGDANATFPGLTYYKGFKGELKEGTIYGISSTDHLNNFANVTATNVYLNGTKTTVSALRNQDLTDKTVRFAYEPAISVGGIAVTKDNCNDILPWEEFKASFDYATNTLYLKRLSNPFNTLNGIQFSDFDLRIVVEGHWRINGSIVGTNGDLVITANHFALTEEDGDALNMHPGDNTSITLDGHRLTLTNRVRLLCFNSESGHTPQSAVKCNDMWVNNSWFDAWGKKPVVDCAYGSVVNATIKIGSLKNNDVVRIEPNIQKYVVWVDVYDNAAGSVTGDGLVNEGVSHTVSATPKSGYHFLRWSNGVTDNPYTFTVTQDTVLYALFEADVVINYYDIDIKTADVKMGLVSGPTGTFEEGTKLTFEAIPASGYQFLYWMDSHEQVVSGSEVLDWTVTADEILTAHFRVQPPADAYMLWVCGTQVTGSNSADILGDGVWCYDHATRTLSTMKMATYNITNNGFIEDWVTDAGPLTVVFNHLIDATCTTTDNVIRTAIVGTKGMTFTGSAYNGPTLYAKNMYPANFSDVFTVTGHITASLYLQNTTDFGRNNFATAILLSGKTPSLVVNGANLEVLSGVGESTGYKVSNKTDQAANLSLINAVVDAGSISAKSLYISDNSPKYEINYLTPSIESLCAVGGFNSFYEGTHITLRAYPATGYKFVRWSDGNTDNPRYMVMLAENVYLDPIVEVDESLAPKGAIINANATEGQGSITNFTSGWYAEGTELTITAVAAEGYTFVQWSDGETANPYLLTVENGKNINITAVFKNTDELSGFDSVTDNPSSVTRKLIKSGLLLIERNGKLYTVQGQIAQ